MDGSGLKWRDRCKKEEEGRRSGRGGEFVVGGVIGDSRLARLRPGVKAS